MSPARRCIPKCLVVLCVLFGFISLSFLAPVYAQQNTGNPIDGPESKADYYSTPKGQEEIDRYRAVIEQGCEDPSLECLVHNITRFVAIEWLHELKGAPAPDTSTTPPPPGGSPNGGGMPNQSPFSGAVGGIAFLISSMYSYPAAQTHRYIADVMESANIVQPAYAQGLGFAALDPVLSIWKAFRNIAYMFFVLIFLIIGFMIMFRQKISGQAAVTVQQAMPGVIISLIFVTFSYAIAGFMIDLMYVSMFLIIGLFENTGILDWSGGMIGNSRDIIDWNIFQLAGALIGRINNIGDNFDFVKSALQSFSNSNFLNNLGALGGGITVSLILVIAMIIGMIKLFFELLRSYATIILSVVVAPLYLMMGAIPGQNSFMPWIRTIAGNLLPFPTVLLGIILFLIFNNIEIQGGTGFAPPFLLGSGNVLAYLLGLAIILALPEIVKKMRDQVAPQQAFGEMIMNTAKDRFKEGQSKIPIVKNWSPTNAAKGVAKLPLRLGGAHLAGKAGQQWAKATGKSDEDTAKVSRAAKWAGFTAAPSLARNVPTLASGAISQAGQALIKEGVDFAKEYKERRAQEDSELLSHRLLQTLLGKTKQNPSATPTPNTGTGGRVSGAPDKPLT